MMRSVLLTFVVVANVVGCESSPLTSFNSKALYSSLQPIQSIDIVQAKTGMITSFSKVAAGKKSLLIYFTHLGDLSSWELAQKLNHYMPKIKSAGLNFVGVAPGATTENAEEFSLKTGLSTDDLYLDFNAVSYNALMFSKGFMPNANISPYLKLLPMLVGIQSEGTISEVLRGYFGDKTASSGWIKSALRLVDQDRFDVLGTDYQRPMELASVRLQNMMDILPSWDKLIPSNLELITQQGGAFVTNEEGEVIFEHRDTGILKYVNVEMALAAAGVVL